MNDTIAPTGQLIRKLSRRQWWISLAIVALALGSLFLGWRSLTTDQQAAEMVNLAGRQRMLSQRMSMLLTLQQHAADAAQSRRMTDMAAAAAAEFEQAHRVLIQEAAKRDPDAAIRSSYLGPGGNIDAQSRRYLAQVRSAIEATATGQARDAGKRVAELAAAGDELLRELDQVTLLYQREDERKESLVMRLMLISTLLMVSLAVFAMLGIFRPLLRRLTDDAEVNDRVRSDLKESQARFQAFSESSSDWFWQTDQQHRFSWTQDGVNVQTPLPVNQVLGRTRLDLRPEIEKLDTRKWEAYQATVDAHRPFRDLEYQIGADDQPLRWISVSGLPWFEASGNFLGYRGTAKYIQERKEIEASHLRMQLAIEQSPVSILIIDADARIIYVNGHFCAVTGYGADEALGRRPKDLLDSGRTPQRTFATMSRTLAAGRIWRGELCCRRKDGALYWDKLSVSPVVDHLGKLTHYIAVGEDVTELRAQRRREQDHHRILEAIANGTPLAESLALMVAMAEAELPEGICTLQRLDRTRGKLFNACSSRLPAECSAAVEGLEIGDGVGSCGTAAFTGRRVIAEDIASHPYWQAWRGLTAAAGLRACWSQPILSSGGKVLGTLAIYYRKPCAPGADETRVIELVASLAAICLERDEAEAALRRQEERARTLLAEHQTILGNALVGIVYLKHRRVVSCNRRLEEIFGYDPGELIGQLSRVFYDSDETFGAIGAAAYGAVAEGRNFSTELTLKHKDGSLFRGALHGRAIDPAQAQEGSIWIYADISERYRAEQEAHKLLQAIEQCPVSIVITNRDGLIEYVNPRFTRVTGYRSAEVLGQNPRFLQSGETPPETYQDLWQTLLAGREWRGVLRNRRKNGELFWEEASISPIVDDANQVTHFLAVKEDITERKRVEHELEQHRAHLEEMVARRTTELVAARQQAEAANVTKSAFLANMSHEIRTPMNGILGMAHLLRRSGLTPMQAERLDTIDLSAQHLLGIINDILDLSKIEAGRFNLEETSVAIDSLLGNVSSILSERAMAKGVRLLIETEPLPYNLAGDFTRLQQALLNYATNAVKFTESGSVVLRTRKLKEDADSVLLRFEVQDTGIGIPPDVLPRLFKDFEQADNSTTRKYGGTGLGLSITRRLAELMGGAVGAESALGSGSTFWFSARLRKAGERVASQEVRQADAEARIRHRHAGRRVLVVDDEPINREIAQLQLEAAGLEVETAADGVVAAAMAQVCAYAVILMDMQMPNLNGLDATQRIRQLPGHAETPIIAMTANAFAEDKARCFDAGMNDFLVKPFNPEALFATMLHWLDKSHS